MTNTFQTQINILWKCSNFIINRFDESIIHHQSHPPHLSSWRTVEVHANSFITGLAQTLSMPQHPPYHLNISLTLCLGQIRSFSVFLINFELNSLFEVMIVEQFQSLMHNYFHNDAVKSGESEQVWLYDGATSPLLAGLALLSIDFEVDPKLIEDFVGYSFKIEAEDDHSIVSSPLPHVIFFLIPFELGTPVVFALEPQLNGSLDLVLVAIVSVLEEGSLAEVRGELKAHPFQVEQFLLNFSAGVLPGVGTDVGRTRRRDRQFVVDVSDFLLQFGRVIDIQLFCFLFL